MATRFEVRTKLEKLLALAARPGTPAEGEAALAAAERLASRYGFTIKRRAPRARVRAVTVEREGACAWCGRLFQRATTGRPRVYCSVRCRVAHHRAQQ